MNTIIFRTVAPLLVVIMVVFSIFVLLRGHNQPGGGFIGGLIAAAGIAIYGMAAGVRTVRAALKIDPLALAGFGVFIAAASGLLSLAYGVPFLTGIWNSFSVGGATITISSPMVFDIGVYCVVLGTLSAVLLGLEDDREGGA